MKGYGGISIPPKRDPRRDDSTFAGLRVDDLDFRVSRGAWQRLRPFVLWVAVPLGGLVLGYYQGLQSAAMRVRANEALVDRVVAEISALRATIKVNDQFVADHIGRLETVSRDHDTRLPRIESRLDLLEVRAGATVKSTPLVIRP